MLKLSADQKTGNKVELTRQLQPDIVIPDIMMPEMTGIEATVQILEEFPAIGIIAFSIHNEEGLIVDRLKAGAIRYILTSTNKKKLSYGAAKNKYILSSL